MNDEIATNLAGERLATGHMPVPAPNAQQEPVRAGVVRYLEVIATERRTTARAAGGVGRCARTRVPASFTAGGSGDVRRRC